MQRIAPLSSLSLLLLLLLPTFSAAGKAGAAQLKSRHDKAVAAATKAHAAAMASPQLRTAAAATAAAVSSTTFRPAIFYEFLGGSQCSGVAVDADFFTNACFGLDDSYSDSAESARYNCKPDNGDGQGVLQLLTYSGEDCTGDVVETEVETFPVGECYDDDEDDDDDDKSHIVQCSNKAMYDVQNSVVFGYYADEQCDNLVFAFFERAGCKHGNSESVENICGNGELLQRGYDNPDCSGDDWGVKGEYDAEVCQGEDLQDYYMPSPEVSDSKVSCSAEPFLDTGDAAASTFSRAVLLLVSALGIAITLYA